MVVSPAAETMQRDTCRTVNSSSPVASWTRTVTRWSRAGRAVGGIGPGSIAWPSARSDTRLTPVAMPGLGRGSGKKCGATSTRRQECNLVQRTCYPFPMGTCNLKFCSPVHPSHDFDSSKALDFTNTAFGLPNRNTTGICISVAPHQPTFFCCRVRNLASTMACCQAHKTSLLQPPRTPRQPLLFAGRQSCRFAACSQSVSFPAHLGGGALSHRPRRLRSPSQKYSRKELQCCQA
ncbi:hypothetical protein QBC34DRAFT_218314 [Podospora aff. communis PSN243]|uniref:C3H1-type domain-containing protein n=1 Tax=Podospora aff. communis PSN243 TaxID=3040156 RepID=A0AAV9GYR8_9PEZI|nr:hypothetical protein QBC34DRAFT_218314 [Podospora aff. communis PSN243]